jgi:hypothetical protein
MRLSMTDLKSKCACHRKEHDSFNPAFSTVVGMSVVCKVGGKDVWIAINAQARKLVDASLASSQMYRPMLMMVLSEYEKVPESRKIISKSLLLGQDEGGMVGYHCIKIPAAWTLFPSTIHSFTAPFSCWWLILVCPSSLKRLVWCRPLKCYQTPHTFSLQLPKACYTRVPWIYTIVTEVLLLDTWSLLFHYISNRSGPSHVLMSDSTSTGNLYYRVEKSGRLVALWKHLRVFDTMPLLIC